MSKDNNKKFVQLIKKIFIKLKPRFSFHYVAYTTMTVLVAFSIISIAKATTPNPGHPWDQVGDGVFAVTNNQTSLRTYTFPDANTTILTTNAAVTVTQGGTGLSSVASGSILGFNSANTATAITSTSGTKILTNTTGVISWETAPSSMVYPGAGIPVSTGSAWGTSITNNSANWNSAYGWGDHSSAGYLLATGATTGATSQAQSFTNGIISPTVLGGTSTTQDLTFQTTSGVGATGADMHFLVGSNGGTEALTILNNGNVGIGISSPSGIIHTQASSFASTPLFERNGQTTDTLVNTTRVIATKTTNMSDGFGSAVYYGIQDDAGVINNIGVIGAVRAGADNTGDLVFSPATSGTNNERMRITSAGSVGIGISPTATLHLKAGTATANTAPLKFTSGTLLSSPEAGAMEFDGTHYYATVGSTRYQLDQQGGGNVSKVGTPVNNQIGVWTGDGTIEGDSGFTWDGSNLDVVGSIELNSTRIMYLPNQTNFTNSLVYGTGGANLSHTSGFDGQDNSMFGIGAGNALTTGAQNSLFGLQAGNALDVNLGNTAFGTWALRVLSGSGNNYNGAFGYKSLYNLTSGTENVGLGDHNLTGLVTGSNNTSVGAYALWGGSAYDGNTAIGHYSFYNSANNAIGNNNTAVGNGSGIAATGTEGVYMGFMAGAKDTGTGNVFVGSLSGSSTANTTTAVTSSYNTGVGTKTLYALTGGTNNSALGLSALQKVTTGGNNTAVGTEALWSVLTTNNSTAMGYRALYAGTGTANTAVGVLSLSGVVGGTNNTGFGYGTGTTLTTGSNNTFLGYSANVDAAASAYRTVIGAGASGTVDNSVTLGRGTDTVTVPGEFGVGTNNPSEKIEVVGNIYINNSGGYLKFYNGFKFTDGTGVVTVSDSGGNTIMVFDEL